MTCSQSVWGAESDLPLYRRIASRERGALEQLVIQYSARVQILIFRFIEGFGTIEDAEELASDVYLKIWQDIDKFDPTRGSFDTWVNMIAKYTALDFRRKMIRRFKIMQGLLDTVKEELQVRSQATSSSNLDQETLCVLKETIEQLPEDKQKLIALRFGEARPYTEIADLMGKPIGTIKSTLHRTLRYLRNAVSEQASDA